MIYLITGIPGSGKTLYAVSTLIKSLMADKMDGPDGKPIQRRLVVDGIPKLALPHELMAKTTVDEKTITVEDGGSGVGNWWEWCKPGDVIVIDEVQRIWRPRAMGSKPPRMVTELETHRHKGVDLVLITQSPMLIDQNVRRLVGRHQHVRRLFGMARAMIYDWDGCQADVHRVATASKTMWAYPKDAYKLYASSELHTKQKQKFPVWAALPVLALVAGLVIAPKAFGVLSGSMTGKGISSKTADASVPAASAPSVAASAPVVAASEPENTFDPDHPDNQPPSPIRAAAPVFSGCAIGRDRCVCIDTKGSKLPIGETECRVKMSGMFAGGSVGSDNAHAMDTLASSYSPQMAMVSDAQSIRDMLTPSNPVKESSVIMREIIGW